MLSFRENICWPLFQSLPIHSDTPALFIRLNIQVPLWLALLSLSKASWLPVFVRCSEHRPSMLSGIQHPDLHVFAIVLCLGDFLLVFGLAHYFFPSAHHIFQKSFPWLPKTDLYPCMYLLWFRSRMSLKDSKHSRLLYSDWIMGVAQLTAFRRQGPGRVHHLCTVLLFPLCFLVALTWSVFLRDSSHHAFSTLELAYYGLNHELKQWWSSQYS